VLTRRRGQHRSRVLVMDSDGPSRDAWEGQLRNAGFEVTRAGHHTEFCLKLLTWFPDVVLAAAAARHKDNLSLVRLVRTSTRRQVPAVLLADRMPGADLGARIVLKPFALADVVRELNAALLGRDGTPPVGCPAETHSAQFRFFV